MLRLLYPPEIIIVASTVHASVHCTHPDVSPQQVNNRETDPYMCDLVHQTRVFGCVFAISDWYREAAIPAGAPIPLRGRRRPTTRPCSTPIREPLSMSST